MKPTAEQLDWTTTGWGEHAKLRREISQTMTFAERLRWLESATRGGRLLRDAPVVAPPAFARRERRAVV